MKRLMFSVFALLLLCHPALALDKEMKALMNKLDCKSYQLTKTRQVGKLTDEIHVWLFINEGPTSVKISSSDGARIVVKPYTEEEDAALLTGDSKFNYSFSLASKGSALLHVCQAK